MRRILTSIRGWSALRGWRAGLLAAVLGALAALALPPLFVLPALLVAVPGLLLLVGGAPRLRAAFWVGFWFGFGHHLVGLYWITEAILLESARYWWLVPLAVPGLAAILAPFIGVACAVAYMARPGWRRVAALAGAWVLADLARQFIGTGFPWNPWGSVWELPGLAGDVMIQPASWIGIHGLTLLTLLLAATPILGRRAVLGSGVVLVAWAGLGAARLARPDPAPAGVEVVLVQGNVAQGQKWDQERAIDAFRRHLALTRQGVQEASTRDPGRPSVVIWPETASPFLLPAVPQAREAIMQAAAPARAALVGSLRLPRDDRPYGEDNLPRNSLVAMLPPDGAIVGLYDKWHLVPFGEYAPSWVPFSVQVVPGRLGFGSGPETLHVDGLPAFDPLICYEAIFPAQVVDRAERPGWMVNITNDAWFGNSTGPRQHLAAARMRAVEEGLPLMRAANTGITAGFDARGRELGRLEMGVPGVLVLSLPGALPPTPFARWGLVLPGVLALVVLGAGFGVARKRRVHSS